VENAAAFRGALWAQAGPHRLPADNDFIDSLYKDDESA
jgi:hypothetical protein